MTTNTGNQSTFLDPCMDYHALNTLGTVLNDSLTNYTSANDGYDAVFGDYQQYMKEMIPSCSMSSWQTPHPMQSPADLAISIECTCEGYGATSTQQCPFTYKKLQGATSFIMTYKLTNSSGFYIALQSTYAIKSSWVTFGDTGGRQQIGSCAKEQTCIIPDFRYVGIPVASSDITIPNPKDVITSALPTLGTLQNTILARQMDLNFGSWNGSADDLLQVFSMPVFMIQQAVTAMQSAKAIGYQVAKEKKIALTLEILGAVFAFLPFLDDIAPELEALDGVFDTLSQVGNVALTIQGIVSDPASAPMAILGLLTAPGVRDEEDYASTAATRRAMTEDELSDIGQGFDEADDQFEDTIAPTCRT